ncbi:unnamed protein product [Orchesella dallaii]|uniref:Uncharacterized protein n=1 Tax=Orchesella dallaii TaxID=48710 RepID=A0ABP1R0S3_9HEXA
MSEEQRAGHETPEANTQVKNSDETQTISRVMELINDGVLVNYCEAIPGSVTWHEYQLQRMLALQRLKLKSLAHQENANKELRILMGDVVEDPHLPDSTEFHEGPPTILKKIVKNNSPTVHSKEGGISWKVPIADTRILAMTMPLLKVPDKNLYISKRIKAKPGFSKTKTENENNGRTKTRTTTAIQKSTSRATQLQTESLGHGRIQRKLPKRNNEKANTAKPNPNVIKSTSVASRNTRQSPPASKSQKTNPTFTNRITATQKYLLASSKTLNGQTNRIPLQDTATALTAGLKATLLPIPKVSADNRLEKQSFDDNPKLSQAIARDTNNNLRTSIYRYTKSEAYTEKLVESSRQQSESSSTKYFQTNAHLHENLTALNGGEVDVMNLSQFNILSSEGLDTQTEENNNGPLSKVESKSSYGVRGKAESNVLNKKDSITRQSIASPSISKRRIINDDNDVSKSNVAQRILIQSQSPSGNSILQEKVLEALHSKRQPPVLPELQVCDVLPGTASWDNYWTDFNKKVKDYYVSIEQYSQGLDGLLDGVEDVKLYKQELRRRYLDEAAMRISMGIPSPKPPLIRQPLKDTIDIGGYIIRALGGDVAGAFITTYDHSSFRLEIQVERIDSELDSISIDTKSNTMTINIPSSQKGPAFRKLIQISVPSYKKVRNLEIGNPLYNGGKMIITGK